MHLVAKILMIVGLGLTIYFGFELMLLSYGTSQPQVVALSELGRKGPVPNVHVTVHGFCTGDDFVLETSRDRWTRVWVPLLTTEGQWTERPVVAYVTGVQNEQELAAKIEQAQLTGVITNGMQGLGKNQQEKFAPLYPSVDLSDAIALQVGRSFPNPVVTMPLLMLGIVLLLGGGAVTFGLVKAPSR